MLWLQAAEERTRPGAGSPPVPEAKCVAALCPALGGASRGGDAGTPWAQPPPRTRWARPALSEHETQVAGRAATAFGTLRSSLRNAGNGYENAQTKACLHRVFFVLNRM